MSIILVRGLPGSGKSTLGARLVGAAFVVSADDYMVDAQGNYAFDPRHLKEAHEWCETVARSLHARCFTVVVANPFTQPWEMAPYYAIDPHLKVIDLFDGGLTDAQLAARNIHGVPKATIAKMRARYRHDDRHLLLRSSDTDIIVAPAAAYCGLR